MLKHAAEYATPEVLTEEELELISGGVTAVDGNGNLPTCPQIEPIFQGVPILEPQGPIK